MQRALNTAYPATNADTDFGVVQLVDKVAELRFLYAECNTSELLAGMIGRIFAGRIALVSSFGAESAVLLHMVAQIDPALPVVFLDTGKLFPETLAYRDMLAERLGLTDIRSVRPGLADLTRHDPAGKLHRKDPDSCCYIRKTKPLDKALEGFDAWITGRKRFQGGSRNALPEIEGEPATGRIKINPLARWRTGELAAYLKAAALPRHPLVRDGFRSVGCRPCTVRSGDGENPRAGRWAGLDKTECGIHEAGI